MKTKLLIVLFFGIFEVSSQTTHNLNWALGINGPTASLTIEVGDTVIWTWTDAFTHTVTSLTGPASLNSGFLSGNGMTYQYTFTNVGVNTYQCDVHPLSMFGTITVDPALGIDDNQILSKIKISPNPVSSVVSIELPDLIESAKVQLFDILGKQLLSDEISKLDSEIDISALNNGIYLVKVSSGNSFSTKRIIKQ